MAVDAAFPVDAEHGFLGLGQAAHVQRAGFAANDHGNAVVIQRGAGRFRHLLKVGGPDGLDVLHAERPDDGFHVDAGQRRRARGLRQGRVAAR